jgi:hypothetical protein
MFAASFARDLLRMLASMPIGAPDSYAIVVALDYASVSAALFAATMASQ